MAESGDVVLDIRNGEGQDSRTDDEKWETFCQKVLSSRRFESVVVIPQVPDGYLESYKKSYSPKLVSIGPYHHGKRKLQTMEDEKSRCLKELLERSIMTMDACMAEMCRLEQKARRCYQESIKLCGPEFVQMMMLDAAFIIVNFLNAGAANRQQSNFTFRLPLIKRDMLLLENQLPFFVLQKLFDLTRNTPQSTDLISLAIKFLNPPEEKRESDPPKPEKVHHLLHLYQSKYISYCSVRNPKNLSPFPGATTLDAMGVKFDKAPDERLLTDVQFGDGKTMGMFKRKKKKVLEIPRLLIAEDTVSRFINLVAFEQSNLTLGTHFTCYASFMSYLLSEASDVEFLCEKEIIDNMLGSPQEVVNLFKSLRDGVTYDLSTSMAYTSSCVGKFSNSHWRIWKARVKTKPWWSTYFTDPVTLTIALVGGVGLWALTATQTFYTVYCYYHPSS